VEYPVRVGALSALAFPFFLFPYVSLAVFSLYRHVRPLNWRNLTVFLPDREYEQSRSRVTFLSLPLLCFLIHTPCRLYLRRIVIPRLKLAVL